MQKVINRLLGAGCLFLLACGPSKKTTTATPSPKAPVPAIMEETTAVVNNNNKTDAWLEDLLKSQPQFFSHILQNRDSLKVQVIYTQIDRQANNTPVFKNYYFNSNSANYFYPASTVKMPVALLALQRLQELKLPGLNANSTMITESSYSGQTPVFNDPTTPDGRPSIAQYIRKIFLVSDNDAYNRLYEFLGPQYINEQLHKMGYSSAAINHRLSIALSEDENRHTNPVRFLNEQGKEVYTQPFQFNQQPYAQRNDRIGKGYYSNGKLVNGPLDFSKKNRFALEDLHTILRSILFPSSVPAQQRFNIKPDDYRFVLKYMSQLPSETTYPSYTDTSAYRDAYVKFLLYGAAKKDLPKQIRLFNKVGDAYGFLTDVAYVVDFEKNIEFMVSATIYCNKDAVLNDDNYDYDSLGFPFMKQLGELLYNYELQRTRLHKPDLSSFKFIYDK